MHLYMMGWKCCRNDPHATGLIVSRGVTSSSVIFVMSLLICVSVLLPCPSSQGAPVLECRCCYCQTCSAHRSSYLPLPSISPGVQVLLSLSLSLSSSHSSTLVPATSLAFSSLPLIHFTNFPVMFPVFTVIHLPPHIHFWLTLATGHNFKMWYM